MLVGKIFITEQVMIYNVLKEWGINFVF